MKKSNLNPLLKMTSDDLFQIAERISYLRQNLLHMTQSQFASALNVSQTYLSQIENKKKFVTPAILTKICSSFNVRLDWLALNADGNGVFQSETEIIQYSISMKQEEALNSLCSVFALQESNMDFLRWYLSISEEERLGFQKAVSFLRKLE